MATISMVRLRHLSDCLHDNGKRCMFEFFREQVDQPASSLAENLERFATINPAHLAVTGGDKHVHQLLVVKRDTELVEDSSKGGGEAA